MARRLLCLLLSFALVVPVALAEDAGARLVPGTYRSMKLNLEIATWLKRGDKDGSSLINRPVTDMQKRLIELGYLTGTPSGIYDQKTVDAVAAFKKMNNLSGNGESVDYTFKSTLQSSRAVSAQALVFENYGQWQKANNNILRMRVKVENKHPSKKIKAFELYMYATDVWGERLYGASTVYYGTTKRTIKPGEVVYSDYINLPDRDQIDKVYVGIHRIAFEDDTYQVFDSPEYYNWTISW